MPGRRAVPSAVVVDGPTSTVRPDPPMTGSERDALRGWLDFHRATLAWKCDGLSDDQLRRRSMPPSTLSLLGLVRHMAEVERHWFRRVIAGETIRHVWSEDSDFQAAYDARGSSRNDAFTAWGSEIERSRQIEEQIDTLDQTFWVKVWAAMHPCAPCCFTSSTTTHATTAMPTFFAKVSTGP